MATKQKLELTWIGKENRPRLEPRILLEDPARSYHAAHRVTGRDCFDNRLIFGDNLLALKALEAEFTGKVKCVFIDPPYNTGSAFTHYDDGVEHSIWLSLMRDRLEIIRRLLSEDGSLWITIDDNECHYLKVLCDEVFGRANFVANIIWQKTPTRENRTDVSTVHDSILVFATNRLRWKEIRNPLPASEAQLDRYTNPDDDDRGRWASLPAHAKAEKGRRQAQFFTITTPSGRRIDPPPGRCWLYTEERFREMVSDNRIWFGSDGSNAPRVKKFLTEVQAGLVPSSIWLYTEVGTTGSAKSQLVSLFPGEVPFSTPKPEELIKRIIGIASDEGDLVLDSFAGSGTTGAVAHKMGRRWIMVELGEHCHTHIIPRLKKVIDNDDPGGITKAVGWKGGGGFRYYRLAPSLLEKDTWGNWVINHDYNAAMLAEALCKLEGFRYAPSDCVYWQHGHSTERDFVYVTTAALTHEQLAQLSDEVGPQRSLLVLCTSFRARADLYPNLTVKKIPRQVLSRCEWGHDDYSLRVENLPSAPPAPGQMDLFDPEELS
ncbi:site-specific DNA-methyltransferase [uncultured Thiodictyon sp.]|jgi:adenine-specific DNA-methyltransferase|uniref:site-specific DNA-methyltransferase n=1 Tax=uncultured Thiodictyon sp. TaxID=1846217 RepID=UPI0025D8C03B|nr:site-specific DNA-methyltransferase [uncultured Thiodictyon sp.]